MIYKDKYKYSTCVLSIFFMGHFPKTPEKRTLRRKHPTIYVRRELTCSTSDGNASVYLKSLFYVCGLLKMETCYSRQYARLS
jgi:hypothetical protein